MVSQVGLWLSGTSELGICGILSHLAAHGPWARGFSAINLPAVCAAIDGAGAGSQCMFPSSWLPARRGFVVEVEGVGQEPVGQKAVVEARQRRIDNDLVDVVCCRQGVEVVSYGVGGAVHQVLASCAV